MVLSLILIFFSKPDLYENSLPLAADSLYLLPLALYYMSLQKPTVNSLNFWTPENFAVIHLKFKKRGQILGNFVKKM